MSKQPTFAFVSLGCPKNLVDSERMLGLLATSGHIPVSDPRGADYVVVNTCGFIESARQESRAVIQEMVDLKAKGEVGGVIVTGCLAERMGPQLITEIPMIDRAAGVFGREEIAQIADRFMNGAVEQRTLFRPAPVKLHDDTARLRITPRHYAYLKISEGCDRLCTFCAIPGMRGKHVTKPIETILAEARELISDGVRELLIVSQDTTYYGIDQYGKPMLAELLRQLDALDGVRWIRLLYAYPEYITEELLDVLGSARRIIPYLDMPLQHVNTRVLRRMNRRHDHESTRRIVESLRGRWPGVALRTTFIVGFPGETDAEFEELVEFVRAVKFERCGVFTYSIEEGTPATKLDGHLPEDVKQARRDVLMRTQQEIAFERVAAEVGREKTLVIDSAGKKPGSWIARSTADAPEIDTITHLRGKQGLRLKAGAFVRARITAADGYDTKADTLALDE